MITYALAPAASTAIVRPLIKPRPPTPAPSVVCGPSSIDTCRFWFPVAASTKSIVGAVVGSVFAAAGRGGCVDRAKVVAFTCTSDDPNEIAAGVIGVSAEFSNVPFTTKYCPRGPAVIGPI